MRRRLGCALALLLLLSGTAAARAIEPTDLLGAPSPDEVGNPWAADPSNPVSPAGAYSRATWEPPTPLAVSMQGERHPKDLPAGIPAAATADEPKLPVPRSWKLGDGFPRTSGTGRYADGAFFWSDFLYDDNGAIGVPPPTNESTGAPAFGTYMYPEPKAWGNGADIFRVAIGLDHGNTVWRVDWNTLDDTTLPAAVFVIDSDPDTGTDAWPANANVRSPSGDWAVVMSGKAAKVLDLVKGDSYDAGLTVDTEARSFVVTTDKVPTTGSAIIRVAAGLADDTGTAFRTLGSDHGALPGQPNVYNVAFRDYADEPSVDNSWYDTGQAAALTGGGDVSAFAATVDWTKLAKHDTEREPVLPGYTNRWYVSSIELGQGVRVSSGISTNGPAAYVGRVQPYAIYVPHGYAAKPTALTWMLHGASSSHNSAQVHPRYSELACERRNSICVNPLGRGPSGGWKGYAELDFWEVWNRVATDYALDPDHTILSGISMGAFGTYKIAMDHPEAFAAAVTIVGNAQGDNGLTRLTNLRWTPLYARHGAADELVPITSELATQDALDAAGLRHVFDFQPAEDHIAVSLKDAYDDVAEFMAGVGTRETAPPHINYAWDTPKPEWAAWGITRPGAWWLDAVAARTTTDRATIDATSLALANPAVTVTSRYERRALGSPSPTLRHIMDWEFGASPDPKAEIDLTLTNVGALTIDLKAAGIKHGPATIDVTTDGPTVLKVGGTTYSLSAGAHKISA